MKKTIDIYENESKNKDRIREYVKKNEFIQAFNLALNITKIDDIYFVIKKYNYFIENNNSCKYELSSELLSKILKSICSDINLCDNLNDFFIFIKNNIFEKNIRIDKDSSKLLYDILLNLYKNRTKNFLSESIIENIKYLIEYLKKNK